MLSRKSVAGVHLGVMGFVLSALLLGAAAGREAVWIEGEQYVSSSFNRHGWYQNTNILKGLLSPGTPGVSEGGWHTHYTSSGSEQATALYRFTIAEGGSYAWWIRLNPFRNGNGGGNYSYHYRQLSGTWTSWQSLDVSEARNAMIDLVLHYSSRDG